MSGSKKLFLFSGVILGGFILTLSCGGGGGGGGGITPSIPYAGIDTPAFITSGNTVRLASGLTIEMSQAGSSGSAAPDFIGGPGALGDAAPAADLSSLPGLVERTAAQYSGAFLSGQVVPLSAVEDRIFGDCEGYADVSGTVKESSGALDLDIIFQGYSDDCVTYFSGTANMKGAIDLSTFEVKPSMKITYGAMTVTSEGESVTLSGTWSGDYEASPQRETMNMVILHDTTGKTYWLKDFVVSITTGSDASGSFADLDIQGRYYDPDYGYVDVTTETSPRLYDSQWYPSAGDLVLAGESPGSAKVEFKSQVYFEAYCDADGIGGYEFASGLIAWPWQSNYSILARGLGPGNSDWFEPGKAAVGYDGTNYLIATRRVVDWNSSTTLGIFVSELGAVVDTFTVSQSGGGSYGLAFDGTNYLLVYSYSDGSGGQIRGQRITTSGTVLDGPDGFLIAGSDSNQTPAVAFDGTNYLVVWPKYINGGYDIYGARVDTGGQVLGVFPVFEAPGEQVMVSLAFGAGSYLAVWRDTRSGSGPTMDTDIYGARIATDASVLDAGGIPVCASTDMQEYPTLAFDGSNYLVVWTDYRNSPTWPYQPEIYGARVTAAGAVLDPAGIPLKTGDFEEQGYPALDFDGTHFVLAWQAGSYDIYPPSGIFADRLTTDGQLVDSTGESLGIPVSGPPPEYSRYMWPVLKSGGSNSLVVWTNNTELGGSQKEVRGTVLPDLDQFL